MHSWSHSWPLQALLLLCALGIAEPKSLVLGIETPVLSDTYVLILRTFRNVIKVSSFKLLWPVSRQNEGRKETMG